VAIKKDLYRITIHYYAEKSKGKGKNFLFLYKEGAGAAITGTAT